MFDKKRVKPEVNSLGLRESELASCREKLLTKRITACQDLDLSIRVWLAGASPPEGGGGAQAVHHALSVVARPPTSRAPPQRTVVSPYTKQTLARQVPEHCVPALLLLPRCRSTCTPLTTPRPWPRWPRPTPSSPPRASSPALSAGRPPTPRARLPCRSPRWPPPPPPKRLALNVERKRLAELGEERLNLRSWDSAAGRRKQQRPMERALLRSRGRGGGSGGPLSHRPRCGVVEQTSAASAAVASMEGPG